MRIAHALVMTCACGRIAFDPLSDAAVPTLRSQLTLAAPAEPLTDFPLLVVLDDTRAARDRMQPDASDLRFFDSAGTLLPHEIEQVGSAGGAPLVAWVRVPIIDGPTTLTIDYGHGTPPPASTQSVWAAPYAAVYHLGDRNDSTQHALAGTWSGGPETVSDGQIAKAHTFRTTNSDSIVVADAPAFAFGSGITVSCWMNPSSFVAASGYNAAVTQEAMGSSEAFWIGIEDSTRIAYAELGTASTFNQGGGGGTLTAGTWLHAAMTYDGTTERFYINGMQRNVTSVIGGALFASGNPVLLGADANSGAGPDADFFDGMIDEARIETVPRSASWIAYDVASMRDEVITYGTVGP